MKKKILTVLTIAALALTMLFAVACGGGPAAGGGGAQDLIFSDNGEGYTVSGGRSYSASSIVIPAVYNGKPVTAIGSGAFSGRSKLKSVEIPDSVETIGSDAFMMCSYLETVTFGENSRLTRIEENAFNSCAFTDVELPSGVTYIGLAAFNSCSDLVSINIPSGVTYIGNNAFYGCESLTDIELPSGISAIGVGAFEKCPELQPSKTEGGAKYLGSSDDPYLYLWEVTGYDMTSFAVPAQTKIIAGDLFRERTALQTVTFGEGSSLVFIGGGAFRDCAALESIAIPGGVTSVEEMTFDGCAALQTVTFGEGSSLVSVGKDAFSGCEKLARIELPVGVTSIGESAFGSCRSLTSVSIPSGVTSIGENAFTGCPDLQPSKTEDNAKYLGNSEDPYLYLWEATGYDITSCKINANTKIVAAYAFEYCAALQTVTFEGTRLTTIGAAAFTNCETLASIAIPSSVTYIGGSAFYGCTALTSATFGDPAGWYVGYTALDGTELAKSDVAAEYLRDTYSGYTWTKND